MKKIFYDIDDFPQLKTLEDNWKTIQEEYRALNAPVLNINRINKTHDQVLAELRNYISKGNSYGWVLGWGQLNGYDKWLQYGLIINDQVIPFITGSQMEKTLNILKVIKGIKVCALVKLKPYGIIHTHTHPEILSENLLQMHLPIETALERNYAYLNVNGQFKKHECGKSIIFDGSLDHFALNESMEDRTVLYLEFSKTLMAT